jgi:hypothetical protein
MGYSLFVTGLTHHDERKAWPGFTLFTTMSGDAFNLIDMQGKLVHRWTPPAGLKAYYARGLDNGNLLAQCVDGSEEGGAGGGKAATVLELDWDASVVWQYGNPRLHHDHQRRANGNTILIAAEPLDPETSARFAHGDPGTADGRILSESLLEVTPSGETVWQWHAHEHLDPEIERYRIGSGGDQWLHANAVTEMTDGNLIFSFNTLSEVIVIHRPTGKVTWRLNADTTRSQHNPTALENGNILLFDNGNGRNYSRVIEIVPESQEIAWEYTGNPRDSFYSMNISGAQRLPNGNTLVCEGRSARFFEVTPDKYIVWEYISPFTVDHMGQKSRAVFRAHRYASDSGFVRGRL